MPTDKEGTMAEKTEGRSGVELIAAERTRQIEEEHYDAAHDDTAEADGQLAYAAACYALPEPLYVQRDSADRVVFEDPWPWGESFDKRKRQANYLNAIPTEGPARLDLLVKAGALIAAEIDRLQRIEAPDA